MSDVGAPSPYTAPALYDLVLDTWTEDLGFWLDEARLGGGPVLEVACGTGRVLLHLARHGIDVDGLDASEPMLSRLREKAAAAGLAPRIHRADMRDFTMPRGYTRLFIAFNGFAHMETMADQLRCLQCCREHLVRGGALVLHVAYPGQDYWLSPDERVLEWEGPRPGGGTARLWDTRRKNRVLQTQHSEIEIEELDSAGARVAHHRFEATKRWVYRFELELLMRLAGFSRWEILGGWDRRPLRTDQDAMIAFGWRD